VSSRELREREKGDTMAKKRSCYILPKTHNKLFPIIFKSAIINELMKYQNERKANLDVFYIYRNLREPAQYAYSHRIQP